ncbi:MAG: MFS transporter [bacterium]|nr:MFS transporter [bacterium]
MPLGFLVGGVMRLQVLGVALAGFFLTGGWDLIAICIFLGLFGFFMGMQGVIFNFLMGKVIPIERRGVLSGLRGALAGLTAAAVGAYGGFLVENNALGNGYAATFLVAFALTSCGLAMLVFIREPESPTVLDRSGVGSRIAEIPALLRGDRNFTYYFIARALASTGRMAVPFYILFARSEFSGTELGAFSAAFILSQSGASLGWGLIADRTGFRFVFIAAMIFWVSSTLLLLADQSFGAVMLVFSLLGIGLGGWMMASQNLVLEFGEREHLPLRIAVANSTSEALGAIGVVTGGALAAAYSYQHVFWVAIGFKLLALAFISTLVREPRRSGN